MEEKNLKKLLTKQTEEIKRHGKCLPEKYEDRLKVIAEVQIDQGKKLDGHSQKLDNHSQKLNEHSQKLDALLEMVAKSMENIGLIKSMLR